ncbi:hypothetical protein M407DRAFT_243644 [Tulasnella calospora MUT 4182]|uniref:Uncharacterized protein n=1 Tax=Tulasnella calospora MUT 4182 TaxID=1051891 RepID=A0A0C3QIG9_9AGAM|nr:hypothetical protein M407DRAFT_243644 [Tulasnella calospora MUT 4182]
MAHIGLLPTELLSLIFHTIFEEIKASSVSTWEDVGTLPGLLNILSVSSHWSQVAATTLSLWKFITTYREDLASVRERVKRDLMSSKDCPLDVGYEMWPVLGWLSFACAELPFRRGVILRNLPLADGHSRGHL